MVDLIVLCTQLLHSVIEQLHQIPVVFKVETLKELKFVYSHDLGVDLRGWQVVVLALLGYLELRVDSTSVNVFVRMACL